MEVGSRSEVGCWKICAMAAPEAGGVGRWEAGSLVGGEASARNRNSDCLYLTGNRLDGTRLRLTMRKRRSKCLPIDASAKMLVGPWRWIRDGLIVAGQAAPLAVLVSEDRDLGSSRRR